MKNNLLYGLLLGTLSLAAGTAGADDYYLAAKVYTKTMPDFSEVEMWGYVLDPDVGGNGVGDCYEAGTATSRELCVNSLPDPVMPGPRLILDPTVSDLSIFLTNALPEPTSLIITSQKMPWSNANNGPTWSNGDTGSRCAISGSCTLVEQNKRVRTFGREAAASGGIQEYTWNTIRQTALDRPGTFIYHSGTHPQKQVYMGLYGAVTKDAAAGLAYTGVPYQNEIVLFYSEIDPALNAGVVAGTHDTSIHFQARWFLINGEPYSSGMPDIPAGASGESTLLRFLSTAGETHVPVLQGMHMSIHAEDGYLYGWENPTALTSGTAPREQYSVMLPPLKTKDAIIMAPLGGRYAIYDGNGYMTDPTDKDDVNVGDAVGGMLRFLSVASGPNLPPVALDDPGEAAVEGRTITISVLANDFDPEGQSLTIVNVDTMGTAGMVICGSNPGDTCDYTAAGPGSDSFMYEIDDGDMTNANATATVTVTVAANAVPVANDDPGSATDTATPIVVNVLANDTDGNGDTLQIAGFDATSVSGATVSCNTTTGDCTYMPLVDGVDTFTYTATDGDATSAPATVTVTVTVAPTNTAPEAINNAYDAFDTAILTGNVITDDTGSGADNDDDGDPLTATQVGPNPAGAASFTLNSDGSFSYQSTAGFNGPATFDYLVNDGTVDSNTATVTITVTPQPALTISLAECTRVAGPGSNCDWHFIGTKNTGDTKNLAIEIGSCAGQKIGRLQVVADGPWELLLDDNDKNLSLADISVCVPGSGNTANLNNITPTEAGIGPNQPPVAIDDPSETAFTGGTIAIDVLANDSDPEGEPLTIISNTTGTTGTATCGVSSCSYTAGAGVGADTFTYTISDGNTTSADDTATVTVTVSVAPPNSAPVANDNAYSIVTAGTLTGNVITEDTGSGLDSDVDGDPLTATQVGPNPAGAASFTLNADGSFSYQSTAGFSGTVTFQYVANDGTDDSNTATVSIEVSATAAPLTISLAQCTRLGNGNCDWRFVGTKNTGDTKNLAIEIGSCAGPKIGKLEGVADGPWELIVNDNDKNLGLADISVCVPGSGNTANLNNIMTTEL